MAQGRNLERNVRPRQAGESDEIVDLGRQSESDVSSDDGDGDIAAIKRNQASSESDRDDRLADRSGESGSEVDSEEDVQGHLSNVSFKALLQAQDALSKKRKRGFETTEDQASKLDALRSRLQEIKANGNKQAVPTHREFPLSRHDRNLQDQPGQRDEDVSDSAPSEEEAFVKSRTSKHAPASQSSRHQVTRKRNVIGVPKRVIRDPRFDALTQNSAHPGNSDKAYSFLHDYQKIEVAELKAAIKAARSEDDKETLKRKMVSMQNRVKSREAKEREQGVVRQHRKEEKEKVEQGKKPFFLKRKDVKDKALVEKFKGMKGKDREKLMERRKRKEGQKEKKRMPQARRVTG